MKFNIIIKVQLTVSLKVSLCNLKIYIIITQTITSLVTLKFENICNKKNTSIHIEESNDTKLTN
jgi:hypothetical protein